VLEHVRQNGPTHPRALEKALGKLSVGNYWGGSSSATTRVLDALHYRGHLRVARRDGGIKLYEVAHLELHLENPLESAEKARVLVHLLAKLYGPLSETSLGGLVSLTAGYGAPQLKLELKAAFKHAVKFELERAKLEGVNYVWSLGLDLALEPDLLEPDGEVRLLAPFDPIVWDRRRFAHLFGWEYKFEAYTPQAKRKFGYYALPMLWQDRAVGYANLKVLGGVLEGDFGYPLGEPKGKTFKAALERELERMRAFLGLEGAGV